MKNLFNRINKNKNKGTGTFIGYVISITVLIGILIIVLSITILNMTYRRMDFALQTIGRDVVVCESYAEAERLMNEEINEKLKTNSVLKSIKGEITYLSPAETEWKKGVLIMITLTADVKTYSPFTSGTKKSYITVMIENSGLTK